MPIIINGDTGISGANGSATTPTYQGATANTGVFFPATSTMAFSEGGVEAMRIDSSGNVGIGTTTPSTYGKFAVGGGNQTNVLTAYAGSSGFQSYLDDSTGEARLKAADISGGTSAKFMTFYTQSSGSAAAERMRVTTDGQLWLNQTSTVLNARQQLTFNGGTEQGITIKNSANSAAGAAIRFVDYLGNFSGGGIFYTSSNAITYATSSDYRLKENVKPLTKGLETISALKPVSYDWKNDGLKGEGFLAHELQTIVPAAVVGEKDAIDGEGNIMPQGVDYSKIVVHLVAAIQELKAELDALKGTK